MDFLKILDEADISFRWINKQAFGECQDESITINLWLLLAEIFIHEALHYKHPEWMEKRVRLTTDKFLKRMTSKEIIKLGKKVLLRKTLNGIKRMR